MRQVEIPGGTATFRDADKITGNGRKWVRSAAVAAGSALRKYPVEAFLPKGDDESDEEYEQRQERIAEAMKDVVFTRAESDRLQEMNEASAVALLESWTLELPLPTIDTIGELPGDLYDALIAEVRGAPPVAANTDFSPDTDPGSPTNDSGFSSAPSRANPGSPSMPTPSIGGAPSAGGDSSLEP